MGTNNEAVLFAGSERGGGGSCYRADGADGVDGRDACMKCGAPYDGRKGSISELKT